MRPVRIIGQILPSPKDPHNSEEKSCIVYQVPCSDCNFVYIGQTKRDLKLRSAEHKLAIKNQEPEKSALCEHYMRFDHLIDWINSKILKIEARYSKRLTSEAWFINSHPHVMNRSDGDSLPRVYHPLISSSIAIFLFRIFHCVKKFIDFWCNYNFRVAKEKKIPL